MLWNRSTCRSALYLSANCGDCLHVPYSHFFSVVQTIQLHCAVEWLHSKHLLDKCWIFPCFSMGSLGRRILYCRLLLLLLFLFLLFLDKLFHILTYFPHIFLQESLSKLPAGSEVFHIAIYQLVDVDGRTIWTGYHMDMVGWIGESTAQMGGCTTLLASGKKNIHCNTASR